MMIFFCVKSSQNNTSLQNQGAYLLLLHQFIDESHFCVVAKL